MIIGSQVETTVLSRRDTPSQPIIKRRLPDQITRSESTTHVCLDLQGAPLSPQCKGLTSGTAQT
eukprot:3152116-Rhodomonas_salina.1